MARRRPTPVESPSGIRALFLDHLRDIAARTRTRVSAGDWPGAGFYLSPWPALIARIESGEAVVVHAWQVSRWLDSPKPDPNSWVRLEPDGTVTPMKAVHRADFVDFVSA